MKHGHRQTLDPHQVKSATGMNREAWPLRVNDRREDRSHKVPHMKGHRGYIGDKR